MLFYILSLLIILICLWRMFARSPIITHAGGIVFKKIGNKLVYLLVTSKNNEQKWVLPKGGIETGESEEAAALREVKEEAGITGELVRKVGDVHGFKYIFMPIKTSFFLVKYKTEAPNAEKRKLQWLPMPGVIKKAGRPDQKKALQMVATFSSL